MDGRGPFRCPERKFGFFYSLQFHVDPAGMDILRCLQLQVDAAEMVISIVHSFNLKLQICSNETHPNKSIQINNGMVKSNA